MNEERKTCRNCNYFLDDMRAKCLVHMGFVGIQKMKKALTYGNCEDFKSRQGPSDD